MALALSPPLEPQLARSAAEVPVGERWSYEPKFDGFRAIAFVDGAQVTLQSRGGRPLERYFPELRFPAGGYVLDGEIVIDAGDGGQDFGALQQRIHPAASRVALLSRSTPATYVAFDLLALGGESLIGRPFAERRAALEELARRSGFDQAGVRVTPVTRDPAATGAWLGDGEGVVAKDRRAPYRPGERRGMVKVKRVRTIDAVLAGWRPGKEPGTVGSLILGLFGPDGQLRIVGHSSGLSAREKRELPARLAPYETGERGRGEPSRWQGERELEWIALRPELVVEVAFDHASGGRIRHGTRIVRWRTDKPASECRIEQMS
ncbi:MAG TPA: ATP-dependent DNA ligase [Solirubrobacteraceae bacterium]|nr:ATP-dependent DNA ligase [Solirubrobacteraceae bacterium]